MISPFGADAWSTALPDWQDRIMAGQSLVPDLPLFERSAAKALALFKRFRMPDMPGKPKFADVCSQWQFDLVEAIFGSYDPEKRARLINEFFVLIPKKNGKTPTAAAIMLVAVLLNDRPDAEFYLISASHQIANYSFRAIRGIIRADADIEKLFQIQDHLKRITHLETGAVLAIVSADGDIVTGSKASGILIDEMHVLGAKSRADQIMAELMGGFAARPEGFLLTITTQSKEPPVGEFKKALARARRVRDGKEVARLLAILYEFPPAIMKGKRWRDPKIWGMVNPNLGISVDPGYLSEQFRKAEEDGPEALALFASLHLNVEIGVGLNGEWTGAALWAKAGLTDLTLDDLIARCEVAVVGLDGGGLDDLFALAVVGRDRDTKDWLAWVHAWAHPEVLQRRKEISPHLHDFAEAGDLTLLSDDEPTGEIEGAADIVVRLAEAGLLPERGAVGLDSVQVSAMIDELASRGIDVEALKFIGQDWRLSPWIWGIERRLKNGTFLHGNQPMMNWVLGNVKVEGKGSAVRMTKEAAGRAKIDPMIAVLNGFALMSQNPVATVSKLNMDSYFAALEGV